MSAKDRATGKPVRPLLISVQAMRDAFAEIVLDEPELDPRRCLKGYLNAIISPHPYDLVPVEPVLKFDLSKYKFVEEMDVIAGLGQPPGPAGAHARARIEIIEGRHLKFLLKKYPGDLAAFIGR